MNTSKPPVVTTAAAPMQELPPEDESDERAGIVRWIPYVPVTALMILLAVFLIWAEVL